MKFLISFARCCEEGGLLPKAMQLRRFAAGCVNMLPESTDVLDVHWWRDGERQHQIDVTAQVAGADQLAELVQAFILASHQPANAVDGWRIKPFPDSRDTYLVSLFLPGDAASPNDPEAKPVLLTDLWQYFGMWARVGDPYTDPVLATFVPTLFTSALAVTRIIMQRIGAF